MNRFFHFAKFVLDQSLPLFPCLIQDFRLRHRIRKQRDTSLDCNAQAYMALDLEALTESHRAALSLRDQLQRRAQGYLMAVTVATTFSFGTVGLLSGNASIVTTPPPPGWITALFLFAVLLSFFMSTVSALRVLGPSNLYDMWLRSQLPIDPEQKKANLIRFTQLNETYVLVYECQLRGSYIAMRNGVILLFAMLALGIAKMGLTL